jgi:uncharacterized protein YdhG (YjbR/CyaY superfamily)
MSTNKLAPATVDAYIAAFPPPTQEIFEKIRAAIREAAPGVEEVISYQMPGFRLHGDFLVYIGAYRRHIGLYPAPVGNPELAGRMRPYESGKATLRFPLTQPIPYDLIRDIVALRVSEQAERAAQRKG